MKLSEEQKEDFFGYLADLRDDGITNMFGAGAYLQQEFDLSPQDAKDVLMQWMRSFK